MAELRVHTELLVLGLIELFGFNKELHLWEAGFENCHNCPRWFRHLWEHSLPHVNCHSRQLLTHLVIWEWGVWEVDILWLQLQTTNATLQPLVLILHLLPGRLNCCPYMALDPSQTTDAVDHWPLNHALVPQPDTDSAPWRPTPSISASQGINELNFLLGWFHHWS